MSTIALPATTIAAYAKSLVYVGLALLGFAITALADNVVTGEEALNFVIIGLGALVVYVVPNMPTGVAAYSKTIAAFIIAGIVMLISLLSGGVTLSEWLQVIVAAFAGIGTLVPNITPKRAAENVLQQQIVSTIASDDSVRAAAAEAIKRSTLR